MSFQTCGFCMVSVKSKIRFFFSFCSICMAFFHLMNNNAKKWQKEQLSIIEDVCMIAVCFKPLFTPKHEVHIFQWNTLSRFSVNSFFSLYNSKGTWKMVHKLYWLLFIIFAWQLNIDFQHFHERKKTIFLFTVSYKRDISHLLCQKNDKHWSASDACDAWLAITSSQPAAFVSCQCWDYVESKHRCRRALHTNTKPLQQMQRSASALHNTNSKRASVRVCIVTGLCEISLEICLGEGQQGFTFIKTSQSWIIGIEGKIIFKCPMLLVLSC